LAVPAQGPGGRVGGVLEGGLAKGRAMPKLAVPVAKLNNDPTTIYGNCSK
jgi:hypothetical protein